MAERYRAGGNGNAILVGMSFSYGVPWEPDSGPYWRDHLWRNRPCCFLHLEVWRALAGKPTFPSTAQPATLGGHRGDLARATGYGLACGPGDAGVFFCNHTRFRWQANGVWFVASLHRFGSTGETQALLSRLIRQLRPTFARNYGRTTEAGDGVRTHDPQLGKPILGRDPRQRNGIERLYLRGFPGLRRPPRRGMCEGAGRSTCSWMLEPGEYRWELVREGDDVEVRIRDAGGRFRSGVVRQQVRLREFVRAVVSALEGVGSEDVEFLKDWLAGGASETAV